MKKLIRSVRNNILVGLILVTPLVITAMVVNGLFNFVTNRFMSFIPQALRESHQEIILRMIALVIMFVFLFFVGLFFRNMLGKRLYQLGDRLLARIPLINKIYVGTREVIEALFTQRQTLFQEVVLLEYPREGVYALGFVTAVVPPGVRSYVKAGSPGEECLSVFIPTTPNPTSGWFCIIPRSKVIPLPISSGEGMKLVVSGGAVYPGVVQPASAPTLLDKLHTWISREEPGGKPEAKSK